MTYVILLKGKISSIFSWIIAIGTNSKYTHAILMHKGVGYDASERRGCVGKARSMTMYGSRECVVYAIDTKDVNVNQYIEGKMGKKYDWVGILGWLFRRHKKDHFYCFEFIWELLLLTGHAKKERGRVGARHICDAMRDKPVFKGKCRDFEPIK